MGFADGTPLAFAFDAKGVAPEKPKVGGTPPTLGKPFIAKWHLNTNGVAPVLIAYA